MSTPIPCPAPAYAPRPTPSPTRTDLLALVAWQQSTPCVGLPTVAEAELAPPAAMFGDAAWPALRQGLLDQALAQPVVALRADSAASGKARAGPVTHDLVLMLRGDDVIADESEELDLVVRWWQAARQAGLPVDADFGEVWRAYEGLAVLLGLRRLHAAHAAGEASRDTARAAARVAGIARTALRYGPLKPLLRMLEPLGAAAPGAGYTF